MPSVEDHAVLIDDDRMAQAVAAYIVDQLPELLLTQLGQDQAGRMALAGGRSIGNRSLSH